MIFYKIIQNVKHRASDNTKIFFNECLQGYLRGYFKKEEIELKTIFTEITQGKIAVFPIWEKQTVEQINNFIDLGFTCYLLKYRDFVKFRELYLEECVK